MKRIILGIVLATFIGMSFASECDPRKLLKGVEGFQISEKTSSLVKQTSLILAPAKREQVISFLKKSGNEVASIIPMAFFGNLAEQARVIFEQIKLNARELGVKDRNCILNTTVNAIGGQIQKALPFEPASNNLLRLLAAVLLNMRPWIEAYIEKYGWAAVNESTSGSMQLNALLLVKLLKSGDLVYYFENNQVAPNLANGFHLYIELLPKVLEKRAAEEAAQPKKVWIPSYLYLNQVFRNPDKPEHQKDIAKWRAYGPAEKQLLLQERPELRRLIE